MKKNNLATKNPALAKEWNILLNKQFTPYDFAPNSHKKVYWLCKKGHTWQATIKDRNQGNGCPYCSGRIATPENCLAKKNPNLAMEWLSKKNKKTPEMVKEFSGDKVWWICKNNHEYLARISDRSNGDGCPYCSGKKVNNENCLARLYPNLEKEWNNKNNALTPYEVTPFSNKNVWWVCQFGHEWKSIVANRVKGNGCPVCKPKTSRIELRVFTEIKSIFEDALNRNKVFGVECDIFIPSMKIAIEVDGKYWHEKRLKEDKLKDLVLKHNRITLIRLREKGLKVISPLDINFKSGELEIKVIHLLMNTIKRLTNQKKVITKINKYLKYNEFQNNSVYKTLIATASLPKSENTLLEKSRKLARQWHPTKNGLLTPKNVSFKSSLKVWWICKKNHEWDTTVYNRFKGNDCPYCSGRKVNLENSLLTKMPDLAKEWNYNKNKNLKPYQVSQGSNKKVWWICKYGHEWEAMINNRNKGKGCPYCSGRLKVI